MAKRKKTGLFIGISLLVGGALMIPKFKEMARTAKMKRLSELKMALSKFKPGSNERQAIGAEIASIRKELGVA